MLHSSVFHDHEEYCVYGGKYEIENTEYCDKSKWKENKQFRLSVNESKRKRELVPSKSMIQFGGFIMLLLLLLFTLSLSPTLLRFLSLSIALSHPNFIYFFTLRLFIAIFALPQNQNVQRSLEICLNTPFSTSISALYTIYIQNNIIVYRLLPY